MAHLDLLKMWYCIVENPVLRISKYVFQFHSLPGLFNQVPSQLPWESFSHAAVNTYILFGHKYPSLSTASYQTLVRHIAERYELCIISFYKPYKSTLKCFYCIVYKIFSCYVSLVSTLLFTKYSVVIFHLFLLYCLPNIQLLCFICFYCIA